MHLRVLDPDMALSRLDVSYITAAHCIIRPILLFRKWEDISRAIIGVNMWSECVECYPHHFRAAQAHALARDPDMALSRRLAVGDAAGDPGAGELADGACVAAPARRRKGRPPAQQAAPAPAVERCRKEGCVYI